MNLENAQEFIAETEKELELGNFNAFTDVVADGDDDDQLSAEDMKKELTNCIYLQDASVELYGLKFYGTPWQPEFGGWAFNLPRGQVRIFFRFLEEKKKHIFLLFEKMVVQITQPFISILYYYSTKVLYYRRKSRKDPVQTTAIETVLQAGLNYLFRHKMNSLPGQPIKTA